MGLFRNIYTLFSSHFGLSGRRLLRSSAAIYVVLTNLAVAFLSTFISSAFDSLSGALLPGLTYGILFSHIGNCLFWLASYGVVAASKWWVAEWLGDSLAHAVDSSLIKRWVDKKSFYGIKFVDTKKNKLVSPVNILGADVENISKSLTFLVDDFIQSFFRFCVGAYYLWLYSVPVNLNLAICTFAMPGSMFLGAVIYAVGHYFLASFLEKRLKELGLKLREKRDQLLEHLYHISEHGEEIALKKGSLSEKAKLKKDLNELSEVKFSFLKRSGILTFMSFIHGNVNYMVGLALSAPSIIAETIDRSMVFSISGYFSNVVTFFTWFKNNSENVTGTKLALERVGAMQSMMTEWERIQKNVDFRIEHHGEQVQVKGLTIKKPSGEVILDNLSFDIPKGKATIIQGASGIGKTTLFRFLAGLWPHAQGELILPVKGGRGDELKISYIPQKPYLPSKSTLIDAISYPESNQGEESKRLIKVLMKKLGLNDSLVKDLEKCDDWSKRLSGGEQQRVAIIGAIVKKPDIIFMDEAMSALDNKNKKTAESCLKKYVGSATIIAIDHNPTQNPKGFKPFFDHKLSITKDKGKTTKAAWSDIRQGVKPFK